MGLSFLSQHLKIPQIIRMGYKIKHHLFKGTFKVTSQVSGRFGVRIPNTPACWAATLHPPHPLLQPGGGGACQQLHGYGPHQGAQHPTPAQEGSFYFLRRLWKFGMSVQRQSSASARWFFWANQLAVGRETDMPDKRRHACGWKSKPGTVYFYTLNHPHGRQNPMWMQRAHFHLWATGVPPGLITRVPFAVMQQGKDQKFKSLNKELQRCAKGSELDPCKKDNYDSSMNYSL